MGFLEVGRPYAPNQVKNIYSYIDFTPDLFFLGGPADGSEAQDFSKQYPNTQCVSVEPYPPNVYYQIKTKTPGELIVGALHNRHEPVTFMIPSESEASRRGGTTVEFSKECLGSKYYTVQGYTIDELVNQYAPSATRGVLWMDIERAEYLALQGAKQSLENGVFQLINLELFTRSGNLETVDQFLRKFGFRIVHKWHLQKPRKNPLRTRADIVFKKT